MKNKTFDCVEMKRSAQERIYAETKEMTAAEKIFYYNKIGEATKMRQMELRVKLGLPRLIHEAT